MIMIQSFLLFMIMSISNVNLFAIASPSTLDTKEPDHIALLEIKSNIVDSSGGAFSSWNDSLHFCEWEGVECGRRHRRVTILDLSSKSLAGSLSPSVGNLSFLRVLSLQNNTLEGVIPTEIGHLFRLEQLLLHNNSFEGNVPSTISNCTNLQGIWLAGNKLVGTILQQVTSMSKLKILRIANNQFREEIPPSIGNLTSLEQISAAFNQFGGNIPDSIGQLQNLKSMGFGLNKLSGTIPPSFYNLSMLSIFDIGNNQLVGTLPKNIGLKLPHLQLFVITHNKFTGILPVSFSNCSELVWFAVGNNSFHGKIDINFGMMPKLTIVLLYLNNFGSGKHDEMNFIASMTNCSTLQQFDSSFNQLKGQLPSCVGNLSTGLASFGLGENPIYGSIPPSLMNLVNLERLGLFHNQFTGTIPSNLGNLQNLHQLYLSENSLTGNIPESVGNLSVLEDFSLANNRLEGTIPKTFQTCTALNFLEIELNNLSGSIPAELLGLSTLVSLNLSGNHLSGLIPQDIGKLHNLGALDLSENKLAGEIPSSIGGCSSIENLQLEGNLFHGVIPSSFTSLRGIKYLDLSRNNFSGQIPKFLEKFSLNYLNLSFNNFEGELPMNGVFANATVISVDGNKRLCGGLSELQLHRCIIKEVKHGKKMSLVLIIVIPIICLLVGLALVSYWLIAVHRRRTKPQQPTGFGMKQSFLNYSYETLLKATNGFSPESLVGMGGFSRVYKGVLEENGATVAVKVLNLDLRGASKSFMAECEAWRNIRHRNLVKIITACSSIDFQGNDFKALVYEFMPNGSLESWLHSTSGPRTRETELYRPSLIQRISIAIDVANAIDYLHHRCEIPIIHCDLKPSNILLDNDMVAHVGDFGLARFFLPDVSSIGHSSSIGLRGTIGYAPPEYGLGSEMSADGDVYSFGIILLEMMTGKRPTDSMFINGLNIHSYARMGLPDCITDIADPILVEEVRNETKNPKKVKQMEECMVSVVKIGIACSVDTAQDRMNMSEVVDELQRIVNILQHDIKSQQRGEAEKNTGSE